MSYKPVSYHPKKKLENELQDPISRKHGKPWMMNLPHWMPFWRRGVKRE